MYSDEIKRKFVNLKLNGFTYNKISNMLNVPRRTLLRWSIEFQNEINQMKSDSLEKFMNALRVTVKHRIKIISDDIKTVDENSKGRYCTQEYFIQLMKTKIKLISALRQFDNLLIPDIDNTDESN